MPTSPLDDSSSHESSIVGKFLILGILATALAMASFGWWYRYEATHETAQFWGPEAAYLIRDAPQLLAYRWPAGIPAEDWGSRFQPDVEGRDIAEAPGITHLRTALLEDRSFAWSETPAEPVALGYGLRFVSSSQDAQLFLGLAEDCQTLVRIAANGETVAQISTKPICAGLKEVLSEVFGEAFSEAISKVEKTIE